MALIPIVENKKKSLGIYVHIPFCRSKCEYCDFYSIPGARSRDLMDRYLDAVILHIREAAQGAAGYEVDTVYFGGGTPSFFGAGGLAKIFAEIDRRFDVSRDAEVSLEANPDSVTLPMLMRLRRAGFNRISLGVQSSDDEELRRLGRVHTWQQVKDAVAACRKAGLDNISLDLIYGLPDQTLEQWENTLADALVLAPGHSARDTFEMLHRRGVPMEAKPFAVGVRIEQRQSDCDAAQYKQYAGHPGLPASTYKLSCHLPNGRGVFSFCVCPGGEVVAAASEEKRVVTNGMSEYARNGKNANSALVVSVTPNDFGNGALDGVDFARNLERRAYQMSGSYKAPHSTVASFMDELTKKPSVSPT